MLAFLLMLFKPACILQPGTPPPEPEESVEVSKLVNVPQDMREAFDYDEVPEEVLQWVFSQEEQVAMIRTLPSMSEGSTIRPATPGEKSAIVEEAQRKRDEDLVEEATNVAGMGAALASDSAAIGMLSMARKPIRCVRSESPEVTEGFCVKPCCQMQLARVEGPPRFYFYRYFFPGELCPDSTIGFAPLSIC
ncbi:hypothetical protein RHSIM_RhsimMtG0006900 (mitochondrion) [Rhododendron simsii]|uniref:Uncharacterized protein n=1 Tax=Rhododendron simsii TaxID=118357 RepID=A0A834G060_RHOSS|nr:hypothetical protein RHSIM_RhsimMtG0006900 [Rhododendron simsii]